MVENVITREITEPKYMDYQEIKDIYWDNWILLSDIEKFKGRLDGGIVRYTSNDSDALYDVKEKSDYKNTIIFYMGDVRPIGGFIINE